MDIENILTSLQLKRPIFHSEADFQHSLAWEIHMACADTSIRLEYVMQKLGYHVDLLIDMDNQYFPIELNYKTKRLQHQHNDEQFVLSNHGAQDTGRYDVVKDIVRIENTLQQLNAPFGFVILLTNEDSYWKPKLKLDSIDSAFLLHQGRILAGDLRWSASASLGSTKGRTQPLSLKGSYSCNWRNYSDFGYKNGDFKYLLFRVCNKEHSKVDFSNLGAL